jgi:DNA (cytosine-5)-methyltransferase 1
LQRRFPEARLHDDVRSLKPPRADVVAGGWPCQDLSVAGLQRGLAGERSGLFFELLRVAEAARATVIVAENVPNLLAMQGGVVFRLILEALERAGYRHVAWRTLNAREFGLPHQRRRVFLVAAREPGPAFALHRPLDVHEAISEKTCNAFYWTAGLQSICYNEGFVPTLKVGSALSIPSPPALHFDGCVRTASPQECLRLQGFDPADFGDLAAKHLYRMAGNAVAAPVGRFVFGSLEARAGVPALLPVKQVSRDGYYSERTLHGVTHPAVPLATNLGDFVDLGDRRPLSRRAATGLLNRLARSGKPCPDELRSLLGAIADL